MTYIIGIILVVLASSVQFGHSAEGERYEVYRVDPRAVAVVSIVRSQLGPTLDVRLIKSCITALAEVTRRNRGEMLGLRLGDAFRLDAVVRAEIDSGWMMFRVTEDQLLETNVVGLISLESPDAPYDGECLYRLEDAERWPEVP